MRLYLRRDFPKPPPLYFIDGGTEIRGKSLDDLLEQIAYQRASRGVPLGNPEQELCARYLMDAPHFVRVLYDEDPPQPSVRQKVAERTMQVWRESIPLRPVTEIVVMEDRLEICRRCPYRSPIVSAGDKYAETAFARASQLLLTPDVEGDGHCSHHLWLVLLGVHLLHPEKLALKPVPSVCWVSSIT